MKYTGNVVPEIMKEEHDQYLNAKRMSLVSSATVYAVVNTAAAGQSSVVLDTGTKWIGLVTAQVANSTLAVTQSGTWNVGTLTGITNDVNIADGGNVISVDDNSSTLSVDDGAGSLTVDWSSGATVAVSNLPDVDINDISKGTQTNDVKVTLDSEAVVLDTGTAYVGLATVDIGSAPTFTVDATGQGDVPVTLDSEAVVLGTGTDYIGLATVDIGSAPDLDINDISKGTQTNDIKVTLDSEAVVLGAGSSYVGLVSAASIHGKVDFATAHTINTKAIAANTSGLTTIFVPTSTFKVTHFLLSANATVGVRIKSGATYLTGNASLNMTLFPGGGIVENGQIANPVYTGATAADSFVIDLDDSVEVAGKVVYYEE